jgi:hypothetical protein
MKMDLSTPAVGEAPAEFVRAERDGDVEVVDELLAPTTDVARTHDPPFIADLADQYGLPITRQRSM